MLDMSEVVAEKPVVEKKQVEKKPVEKKATEGKAKRGPKKTKTQKSEPDHPPYSEMVKEALVSLKERGGSSRQAILKFIVANYFKPGSDEHAVNARLKIALKKGVESSSLRQSKGCSGATGSFRLGEKVKVPAGKKEKSPRKVKAVEKPAAKKTPIKKSTKPPAVKKPKGPKAEKTPKVKAASVEKTSKAKVAKPKVPKAKKADKKTK